MSNHSEYTHLALIAHAQCYGDMGALMWDRGVAAQTMTVSTNKPEGVPYAMTYLSKGVCQQSRCMAAPVGMWTARNTVASVCAHM